MRAARRPGGGGGRAGGGRRGPARRAGRVAPRPPLGRTRAAPGAEASVGLGLAVGRTPRRRGRSRGGLAAPARRPHRRALLVPAGGRRGAGAGLRTAAIFGGRHARHRRGSRPLPSDERRAAGRVPRTALHGAPRRASLVARRRRRHARSLLSLSRRAGRARQGRLDPHRGSLRRPPRTPRQYDLACAVDMGERPAAGGCVRRDASLRALFSGRGGGGVDVLRRRDTSVCCARRQHAAQWALRRRGGARGDVADCSYHEPTRPGQG
mmetsp:Transcript_39475/g.124719  ORF Transcript_39475/g.124719 Transcript_39475/m.124719 type:complete len:266 (+) Transcript_39475:271-1068(+)